MDLMSTVQLLGNFGEFVGAIAVVVTLIYLVRQVRQNTASVRASAYQTWVLSNQNLYNAVIPNDGFGETIRRGITDSKQLTKETELEFAFWNHNAFQLLQATDYLFQIGAVDRDLWESEIGRAAGHLGNPGVRQWWDAGGRTQLTPRFVNLVESAQSNIAVYQWDEARGYYAPDTD